MAELPFMPLYVNDWLGSVKVQLMSDAAYRCYMTLLCYQWKDGYIPSSSSALARLCHCSQEVFDEVWSDHLCHCFSTGGIVDNKKVYTNVRCAEEREKARKLHEVRVLAGKKGGKAKPKPSLSPAQAEPKQLQPHTQSHTQSEEQAQETTSSTKVDWECVIRQWTAIAVKHQRPSINSLNDDRKAKYKARLKEFPEFWEIIEREFEQLSEFAQTGTWLTFDWCLGKKNFPKLAEGNYREQAEAEDLITRKAREAKERRLEREARSA